MNNSFAQHDDLHMETWYKKKQLAIKKKHEKRQHQKPHNKSINLFGAPQLVLARALAL